MEGRKPRRPRHAADRDALARYPLWLSRIAQESRIRADGHRYAGAGNRRKLRDFHGAERAVAKRTAGTPASNLDARDFLWTQSQAERRSQLRAVSRPRWHPAQPAFVVRVLLRG